MSTTIECHVGMASLSVPLPAAFVAPPDFLNYHFSNATRGALQIKAVSHLEEGGLVGENVEFVDALDLHHCVQHLTNNQPHVKRVKKIGLILADKYKPRPGVFGVMFDRGMSTADDPNSSGIFTDTPREGCAVFLGAIRALRVSPIEYAREVEFTAIHELGHLFNLDHSAAECFMHVSNAQHSFENKYFEFLPFQQEWLQECDTNPMVYPGGSPFLPVSANNQVTPKRSGDDLTLTISTSSAEFPCSSPVELTVVLSTSRAKNFGCFVLDRLDPGYTDFVIWITQPDGSRVRYQSPRRYCAPANRIRIMPGKPLARDISIFEGAAGRTFARPGRYLIQVEFNIGKRGSIQSNYVEVNAVPNLSVFSEERNRLFSNVRVRKFLYFRQAVDTTSLEYKMISRHLSADSSGAASNALRYALIRGLAPIAFENSKNLKELKLLIEKIHSINDELGTRQAFHVSRISSELEI